MKKIFRNISVGLLSLSLMVACAPEEPVTLSESGLPEVSDLNVSVSVAENVVTFHVDNKELVPVWRFSENDYVAQNDYKRSFTLPGKYTVEIKAMNKNGISEGSVTKEFTVESTPTLTFLAGNGSKTWVWDPSVAGHFGCGPSGGDGLGWWKAAAYDKAGTGMYDDQITFSTDLKYTYSPGADGKIYVNWESGYKAEYYQGNKNDYDAPATALNTTYSFEQSGTSVYIVFPANTMLSYIPNPQALTTPKYKILTLTENLLELTVDNGGIAWHYRFVPKK